MAATLAVVPAAARAWVSSLKNGNTMCPLSGSGNCMNRRRPCRSDLGVCAYTVASSKARKNAGSAALSAKAARIRASSSAALNILMLVLALGQDRKSVGEGKGVEGRVETGGGGKLKK